MYGWKVNHRGCKVITAAVFLDDKPNDEYLSWIDDGKDVLKYESSICDA